jgi:hypothetical protein
MSLEHFFAAVSCHKCDGDLKLEIKDVNGLSADAWRHFFRGSRKRGDLAFHTLVWDGNPVSVHFFDLLGRCPNLTVLSLSGCFSPELRDSVEACAQFLSRNRTITHFTCAGNERRSMGLGCTQLLIASLWLNRKVTSLDIRRNGAGPAILVSLAELLSENRVVEVVRIEDNGIADIADYAAFFEALHGAGSRVDVAWPAAELETMIQYGTATKDGRAALRRLWERARRRGDGTTV